MVQPRSVKTQSATMHGTKADSATIKDLASSTSQAADLIGESIVYDAADTDALAHDDSGDTDRVRVVFTPSGKRGSFARNTTILNAARKLGVDLDSVCGGRGICGRCQVIPSYGNFSKHAIIADPGHLSAFSQTEQQYQDIQPMAQGRRLGCHTRIIGDMVIDVPADSQVHRQVIRKSVDMGDTLVDRDIRLYYTQVGKPSMHMQAGDAGRLLDSLEFDWGLKGLAIHHEVLIKLQDALRQGDWNVTVAVCGPEIIAIWPGLKQQVYGLAYDVGSTTIACHLCSLVDGAVAASMGAMNPQIRFGEDLMSRVSYLQMHPGGHVEMVEAVRQTLDELAQKAAAETGISCDCILAMTAVGNPIMQHLLLGINPVELGGAPFALATDQAVHLSAHTLVFSLPQTAKAYILPCIAGHVGADTAAVILAEKPYAHDEITLVVDIGTNAEIVLGNSKRLYACSSPTGPAFEGAQITGGQRAAPGAIERVRIDRDTLLPRFKVIGTDLWSNEKGFFDDPSVQVTGICGSGIIEVIAEMYLSGLILEDGTIDPDRASSCVNLQKNGRTYDYLLYDGTIKIAVTQNDVRAIQLAKAALYAGIKLLMDRMGIEQVDRIRLAGAFGSHIDVLYAMVLGLIPDCKLDSVEAAGNAAGKGACIALMNVNMRREIEQQVRYVEKIETAIEPKFQEHFINAMNFPNAVDSFEQLQQVVALPAQKQASRVKRRRTRSRSS